MLIIAWPAALRAWFGPFLGGFSVATIWPAAWFLFSGIFRSSHAPRSALRRLVDIGLHHLWVAWVVHEGPGVLPLLLVFRHVFKCHLLLTRVSCTSVIAFSILVDPLYTLDLAYSGHFRANWDHVSVQILIILVLVYNIWRDSRTLTTSTYPASVLARVLLLYQYLWVFYGLASINIRWLLWLLICTHASYFVYHRILVRNETIWAILEQAFVWPDWLLPIAILLAQGLDSRHLILFIHLMHHIRAEDLLLLPVQRIVRRAPHHPIWVHRSITIPPNRLRVHRVNLKLAWIINSISDISII